MSKYTVFKGRGKTTITHPDKLGKIVVYGNHHPILLDDQIPEWGDDYEPCFTYRGNLYFLSEFMCIERHAPEWMQAYDGYTSDSFFSGILIKFCPDDQDRILAYTYIG